MSYLTDEEYDFIYSRVPRICVDLYVVNSDDKVLLTKRTIEPYINHWHFPGGRVKFKESIKDAIKRILKGELGLELNEDFPIIGTCEFPDEIQKGQERHSISLVHFVQLPDGLEVKLDHTANEVTFFKELPSPIIPPQHDFLKTKGWK